MQALLMNLTQTASVPVPPQVPAVANAEAHSGKDKVAFGNLLQALTSADAEPEEAPTGGSAPSEEEQSAALAGVTEQAVLSLLQGMVGSHPLLSPETEPVLLTAEASSSAVTETVAAGALPMPESVPALETSQNGMDAPGQPEAASVESVPLRMAKATPERTPAEASQGRPDLWQPATELGEEQPTEVPTAEHLPEAMTVPAWNHGRADVFRHAYMHARGGAPVTVGSPTASIQEDGVNLQEAAKSMSHPWSMGPRSWQQTASNARATEQPPNRASVAVSQSALAQIVQLEAVAAGAAEMASASGNSEQESLGFLQNDAVVSTERTPMQSEVLMDTIGAATAQPEKLEQLPESGTPSREGAVAAAQEMEPISLLISPLTQRDADAPQPAIPQNRAEAEAPRAGSLLEPSTDIAPSETSVSMEPKAAVSTVRPFQAAILAPRAESGQADAMPQSSEKVGDSTEATSVPSFSSPALRSSASLSETVNLASNQMSKPSEQLQAALDAGIRQLRVTTEQKGEVTVKMQLYPEDLGEVHVNVRISEGAISAKFQAASQEAAQVIKDSLANLRSALDGQGFSQVSLTAESFGSNLAQQSDRRSRRSPFRDERSQRQLGGIVAESAEASASRPVSGLSRLDYRF